MIATRTGFSDIAPKTFEKSVFRECVVSKNTTLNHRKPHSKDSWGESKAHGVSPRLPGRNDGARRLSSCYAALRAAACPGARRSRIALAALVVAPGVATAATRRLSAAVCRA